MSILKLEKDGDKHTLPVSGVREVAGKFGMQYAFDTPDGDTLFVGKDAADKQLARIGYTKDTCVGHRLLFERKIVDGTKYTNINPAPGGSGGAVSGSASTGGRNDTPAPPASAHPAGVDHHLYERITDYVLTTIRAKYVKADVGLSDTAAAAIAATLYIQAAKHGGQS